MSAGDGLSAGAEPGGPSVALFGSWAAFQGITALDDDRLAAATDAHAAFRADLWALRAQPLAFLGDVPEPAAGNAWLEAGGVRR